MRLLVAERSGGLCEAGMGRADDMSHRTSRGRGGPWHWANVLHLSRRVHDLAHRHPARAYALGWFTPTRADPRRIPVWLARPWPGWWLIEDADDGGPHVLTPLDTEDLAVTHARHFADPATGEVRIPPAPRWAQRPTIPARFRAAQRQETHA